MKHEMKRTARCEICHERVEVVGEEVADWRFIAHGDNCPRSGQEPTLSELEPDNGIFAVGPEWFEKRVTIAELGEQARERGRPVTESYLCRLCRDRRIPFAFKVGTTWAVPQSCAERWLEEWASRTQERDVSE